MCGTQLPSVLEDSQRAWREGIKDLASMGLDRSLIQGLLYELWDVLSYWLRHPFCVQQVLKSHSNEPNVALTAFHTLKKTKYGYINSGAFSGGAIGES